MEKEFESLKNLHIGGVGGISCQHLQVMTTNLLQLHWGWQAERNSMMEPGSAARPTLHKASLDIKTAFDEAKPKHVAQIMDSQNTHGWLTAALLREMLGLEGKAMFWMRGEQFRFQPVLSTGEREGPR